MAGIKSAIMSEIDSLITQTFAENDITELSIVGHARKHLKVVLASANMKSSIIQGTRSNRPTNIYINEYLTQRRSALLYKLRVIKIILQLVQCTPEMVQSTTSSTLTRTNSR